MVVRISAKESSAEIRAAIIAYKQLHSETRKQLNRTLREVFNPVWTKLIAEQWTDNLDSLITKKGSRIKTGNPPALIGAASRRPISKRGGGLVPADRWYLVEYGTRDRESTYQRKSRNGGTHKVTRHTARAFPSRRKQGRIFGPAARHILPRIASHYSQSVIKLFFDAMETR